MKSQAFYCENCGNLVSLRATSCSKCGKRFDAVKCPKCSFSGSPELFENGCPNCGYLHDSLSSRSSADSEQLHDVATLFIKEAEKNSSSFPNWAYWLIGLVLFVLIVVFIVFFIQL